MAVERYSFQFWYVVCVWSVRLIWNCSVSDCFLPPIQIRAQVPVQPYENLMMERLSMYRQHTYSDHSLDVRHEGLMCWGHMRWGQSTILVRNWHWSRGLWILHCCTLCIAPRLCNSLPPDTRNSLSVSTFRSKLKTHLFKLAFPTWILSHPIIGLPTRIWFLFFFYF